MADTRTANPNEPSWREAIARFQRPSLSRSAWQLANTLIPYFALLYLMYRMLDVSYWITLALSVPAAGFLSRIFIIFHDCGHGSYFKSGTANRVVGFVTALLAFFPSYYWASEHAKHHASSGDLDNRGTGEIWTITVQEYLELPLLQRLWYRVYRNPFSLLLVGPVFTFLLRYRFWGRSDSARAKRSVIATDLALLAIIVTASLTIGIKAYVMIQLPVIILAATAGVWLFYVQHQFEDTYWARHEDWSYLRQALEGSSFYKLPRVLQFFTGNIGFHHIHHLGPLVPNYYLQSCHEASPIFRSVKPITLRSSLKSIRYRMWDEDHKKLVGFDYVKTFLAKQAAASAPVPE